MGETLGFIWRDHVPPFSSPAAIPYPFPWVRGADGHPSSHARLHGRTRSYLTAPTAMVVANGLFPTIPVISRSRVDAALG